MSSLRPLSDRLEVLFALVPVPEGGALYDNGRAAADLVAGGTDVSAEELGRLRCGDITDPPGGLLAGIADLFGVPHAYFTDAEVAGRVEDQLRFLLRVRDSGLRGVGRHGEHLTPAALSAVLAALEAQDGP